MCRTTRQAKYMLNDYQPANKNAFLQTRNWTMKQAPVPSDVLWENLNLDPSANLLLQVLLSAAFFFVFLFVMTPASFLVYTRAIMTELKLSFLMTGILSTWLPTLCTLLYQSLVLPYCVKTIVKLEKHHSKSARLTSALQKFLVYNLFYVFILQLFSLQAVSFLEALLTYSGNSVLNIMANSIAYNGTLFCTFLIHSTLIRGGFSLLSPAKLFNAWYKKAAAISDNERQRAYRVNRFPLAANYARNLNVLAITTVYAVTFPVILLPAILYFALTVSIRQYWIDKHNLLTIYYVQPIGSRSVTKRVIKFMLFYVSLFQLLTGGVIMLGNSLAYTTVGAVVVLAALLWLAIKLCLQNWLFKKKDKLITHDEAEAKVSMILDNDAYRHPCEPK
jgi:hypothetical protein